ncbi:MAG: CBS domain-containing protein [Chlorobi bacterium]|nr:CBS domain-containing protein [Chlorobiota bacterium]MCI0715264.1 CBS domain-containing protein [Chlorobiota bacterium]
MKTLRDICSDKPMFYASSGSNIYNVVCEMAKNNVGAVPILDDSGRLRGIFSERDLMIKCVSKKVDVEKTKIDEVMTRGVIVMEAHDTFEDCLKIMRQEGIRHMPVRDGESLIGVVSMRDLMQEEAEMQKQEIENLNTFIYYYK